VDLLTWVGIINSFEVTRKFLSEVNQMGGTQYVLNSVAIESKRAKGSWAAKARGGRREQTE